MKSDQGSGEVRVLPDNEPAEARTDFLGALLEDLRTAQSADHITRLHEVELTDLVWQVWLRPILLIATAAFLVWQTWTIFGFVERAVFGKIVDPARLQLLLATLIAGTLAETYGIIRIMVRFFFSKIEYDDREKRMARRLEERGSKKAA